SSAEQTNRAEVLRALVNPRANQADLLWSQRFWGRAESTGPARTTAGATRTAGAASTTRSTGTARTTRSAGTSRTISTWPARFRFGRHGCFIVYPRRGDDQQTLLAGAGNNDTAMPDRKSTRLNSSHVAISYAVFCLKKKK